MAEEDKLVAMLKSPVARLRYEACELLRVSPVISQEAIRALRNALQDPEAGVVERAEAALCVHSVVAEPHQPAQVGSEAATLGKVGPQSLRAALPSWAIAPIWAIVTLIGWPGGGLVAAITTWLIAPCFPFGFIPSARLHACASMSTALFGLTGGLVLGALQSIALRRYLSRSRPWFLATLGGWLLSMPSIAVLQYNLGTLELSEGKLGFLEPILEGDSLDQMAFTFSPIRSAESVGLLAAIALLLGVPGLFQWVVLRSKHRYSWVWPGAAATANMASLLGSALLGGAIGGLVLYLLFRRSTEESAPLAPTPVTDAPSGG